MSGDSYVRDRRLLTALAHPIRVRVLAYMQIHQQASPIELSRAFAIPIGNVSYHVRRLHALGFLKLVKRTQSRGALEHHYALVASADAERVVAQLAGRSLTGPNGTDRSTHALLDATALAELHRDREYVLSRVRQLEAQTVDRADSTFPVRVVCIIDVDQHE